MLSLSFNIEAALRERKRTWPKKGETLRGAIGVSLYVNVETSYGLNVT